MDDFEVMVTTTLARAGFAVEPEDLGLVRLIHDVLFASVAALDGADPARFPFEPVDPSRAPEPS
ncbi:MAG: hypothetical protein ACYCS7_07705 [Acidimicrobiales bacterium]